MRIRARDILIPAVTGHTNLLRHFKTTVEKEIGAGEIPVRFVVTRTDSTGYHCEVDVLEDAPVLPLYATSIFEYDPSPLQLDDSFNAVLLIPTGIGAEIGGHSGDGGPVARLLAPVCDNLITHPNVVNASDINELPENGLYVEGSVITRLMMGTAALQKTRSNRVVMVLDQQDDKTMADAAINSVSAARATLGLDCPLVIRLSEKLGMKSTYSESGRAVGEIDAFENVCRVLEKHRGSFDAVAISSVIEVPFEFHTDYFADDKMVNPWGGVEAMLTHALSLLFNIPTAHAPIPESSKVLELDVGVVDPRKAAEAVSTTNLHCVLKGLHRSPRILTDPVAFKYPGVLSVSDISCLVIPDGCVGLPTLAALERKIPVIAVRENKNLMQNDLEKLPFAPGTLFMVENYHEAVGIMYALKAGVTRESVQRPLPQTCCEGSHE